MEWISHEDRTLKEHLTGLKKVVESVLPDKEQNFFQPEELEEKIFALIAYHDLAKASIYFQLYIVHSLLFNNKRHRYYTKAELECFINDNKEYYDKWQQAPELKNHSLFGAWMSLYFWKNGINYEFEPFLFLTILKGHHGYLKNFDLATMNPKGKKGILIEIASTVNLEQYSKMMKELNLPFRYGDMEKILSSFKGYKFDQLTVKLKKNKDSTLYFKTLFLYSFLLSADKGDMMLKDKRLQKIGIRSEVIDTFKKEKVDSSFSINKLREEAYQTAVNRVKKLEEQDYYSITLPTGLGKTFTAYKTALAIKEMYAPNFKIVYCLPFTSIIDQNAKVFQEILKNSGINPNTIGIHHHLSVPDINEEEKKDESIYPNWEYMTEGWQNEITITTFVQLWESIFACHNRQLRKFHNLANSIIILDEVQSINPKLYSAFEFVMEGLAKSFNTKFVFVTATQPLLLRDKVNELCLKNQKDYFFSKLNRTQIDTSLLQQDEPMTEEELAEVILENYENDKQSTLVICNTIRFSQTLIHLLSKWMDKDNLFYLSASLIPFSRENTLNEISKRLESKDPIILISTQVVEAGVDIDFDIVYRDFAPLSSINQAAGRCNRNAEKATSRIHLFKSGKEKIYDPTQLDITEKVLKSFEEQIPENKFYELNQRYFEAVKKKIQDGSGLSDELIKNIQRLKFEKIGTKPEYRLFTDNYKTYSYFISLTEEADELWIKYSDLFKIEDNFKKKQEIKLLKPSLMKFVVQIPDYILPLTEEEKEQSIIKRDDWNDFYEEKRGYKMLKEINHVEFF